ncbi:hypothetical protein SAMN06264364_101224 [Quadrisphaera granulorum]|uniref:Uncharacterized protein n=1 Tax=Quadrisphaera granulorum TaxID=317664 RepID=A0A316AFW5_9ACTN|nr:hypothetical protein [Quadrisphaera granulorum]PWJ56249.1 hypothetical protein BXY45_101224 [Quadrisphaera granulorum]SZE94883.1 hypothetical protein SAMN06264364_101224 [Quadrisphaera granulorum]
MTAETHSPAVAGYLARLDEASRLLPDALRAELLAQVREHLAELEASGLDDAGLRVALERFGTPEQLVAAEAEQAGLVLVPLGTTTTTRTTTTAAASPSAAPPVAPDRRVWGGLELSAVLLLALGGFVVPVLAPLVGMVLAWLSPRWTRRTKVGAALAFCAPVVLVAVGALVYALWPEHRTVTVVSSDQGTIEVPVPDDVAGDVSDGDEETYVGGFWDSAYPLLNDASSMMLFAVPFALSVLTLAGGMVSGLWLALTGRVSSGGR